MVGKGFLFQVVLSPMTQSTPKLWWVLNLVILVWWLGVRLMNLHTPGWQNTFAQFHIPPSFTGKASTLSYFPLLPGCEDYSFWGQAVDNISQDLDFCQNWMDSLIRLIPFLLQSLQAFCAWLVWFLIILDHSLLLASNLINYGTRLDLYFCLCPRQVNVSF